ncbi:MAG: hypothetical protein ACI9N9_000030 [Enterobacterales bacterium]|jgi:hypothetical protein
MCTPEQEYKIGANAYEFVQKHRSHLSHAKQFELQSMLKDFAIEQVKTYIVLADVMDCGTCKHQAVSKYVEPCYGCRDNDGYDNFESAIVL